VAAKQIRTANLEVIDAVWAKNGQTKPTAKMAVSTETDVR
jgi:hypothetical protein